MLQKGSDCTLLNLSLFFSCFIKSKKSFFKSKISHWYLDAEKYNFLHLKGNNLSDEVQKCLKPNCRSITWKTLRQESYVLDNDEAIIRFVFDSGLQV